MQFTIKCTWDAEAGVWYVEESDVPGLVAEAPTLEAMETLLASRVPELLDLNLPDWTGEQALGPPSFELITRQRLAIAC